ncbi:facilitated trehalose transporter Tret1-2 homolog [Aedes aegypti]|uniref:Facilitated trehalose transporter Tret1 n=1 Tax=Aedes aegypti TaxID=7159 RepID=A0A6I8TD21_AEDAE|nr:facilitated trehalose transporter Tret1-2 homolog [Aedes aegypti]
MRLPFAGFDDIETEEIAAVHCSSSKMHRSRATFREFLVAGVATISAVIMGLALGWPSPMFRKLTEHSLSDNPIGQVIVESEQSWINSVLAIGGFFGPFAAGFLADRHGRKLTLMLSALVHVAGWVMLLQAASVALMIGARFVLGFGSGCILVTLPMYVGEIASDQYRGMLGSFLQIGQTIGILYVYCIGPYVGYYAFQWICCAVPILFMIFFGYMPETPHYFVSKGLYQQATVSLMYLRDASADEIQPELQAVKQFLQREEQQKNSNAVKKLFTEAVNLKALAISFSLISLQQWTGIDCILSNSELIFDKAQISLSADVSTIIMGTIQVACCCVTLMFVDRVGRKPVLMSSALGLTVALTLLGFYFLMQNMDVEQQYISWIPLTGMVGFIAAFNFGFGPVPWAIAAEIFAHDVKAIGNTINVSVSWILDFLALRFFLLISESFGYQWAFWIFAIICALAFLFTMFFVLETKGLSLQEIQKRLGRKPEQDESNGTQGSL